MNIKIRLSLQFTIIVVVILLFFSALVYYFSYTSQRAKFRETLFERAKNTAILLINVEEIDSSLLKKIHQSTISLKDEEVVITDSLLNKIYSYNIQYLSDKDIRENSYYTKVHFFSAGNKDGVCYTHILNTQNYHVYVMALDDSRPVFLSELREILLWSILFSILLSVLLSYFFSKKAIQPISHIIKSVKEINSSSLSSRLNEGKRKDEIDQLAITFNEMLGNLEFVFKNQEEFVSNASHELRTPLTVMMAEADYLLSHKRTSDEYISHISGLVEDMKKLNMLLNSLLELAQMNRDNNLQLHTVRIDEIIYGAIFEVKNRYEGRKIIPRIQYPDKEDELLVNGNYGLLTLAFVNILDNACKFSNDDVMVEFQFTDKYIKIEITDKGIGIPENEIESIYMPFKRASNVKFKGGFGIGLSLVKKIIQLHDAILNVESVENEGTRFELIFKKLT